ncbi:unnamed protein product [Pocillopora meandrina]|uniref:Uncharacterized protein n=1 Tax=Pocillopora meandrina TaxID=46732 RepID=A0AAU9XNH2_9CNID|nr:unnamed protein product [Pocillopora meandrina]
MSLYERARHYRSHSLKPLNQPSLLTQRSKRTLSLPSKPIIPPLINVQRYHDNWENESDEEDQIFQCINFYNFFFFYSAWYTPVVGLSCSLVIYFWSCALAYYSTS